MRPPILQTQHDSGGTKAAIGADMFAPELRRIFRVLRGSDLIGYGSSDTYISDAPASNWNKYSPSYHDVFPDAASEGHSIGTRRVATTPASILAGRS